MFESVICAMAAILSSGRWVNPSIHILCSCVCTYVCPSVHLQAVHLSTSTTLQWRHDEHDGISNHQPHDCLPNCLFRCRSKKTSKVHVTGLCEGNSLVTSEFPSQRPVMRKMFPFDDVIMKAQKGMVCIDCSYKPLYLKKDNVHNCIIMFLSIHTNFQFLLYPWVSARKT